MLQTTRNPRQVISRSSWPAITLMVGLLASPALRAEPPKADLLADPCRTPSVGVCLAGGRFLVTIDWHGNPSPDATEARPLGPDAVHFGQRGGAALVVQVIDGRAVNGHFWVLSAAVGEPSYGIQVTDLVSGLHRSYSELDGGGGVRDLLALPASGGAAAGGPADDSASAADCPAGHRGVCLEAGRVDLEVRERGAVDLVAGEALSARTAVFRRVGDRDPALVVSVLDGDALDGQRWVLSTAPGGAEWEILVSDRDQQERQRIHRADGSRDVQLDRKPAGGTRVKVTLDLPRAVTRRIPVAGGTIEALSANGTRFTLTIPANALLSPQEISLTPLGSVGGLPFKGGMVGGVEIAPAGLRLAATASLLIAPAQPVPVALETTFGYRAGGAQFFLYPARLVGKPVVLPVIHAGGYGLARGTAAEQAKQLARLPPRAEDQFDQKLWNLHAQRRRLLKSQDGESFATAPAAAPADLPSFYREVFRGQLSKLLAEIAGSCAGRKKWGSYAENFIAKAVADGVAGSLTAETAQLRIALTTGTAACYDEAGRACLVEKESKAVVPMLVYWRQLEHAGATHLVDAGKLASCLKFELEFSTVLDQAANNPPPTWDNGSHNVITTKTPVRWRAPFDFGEGLPGTPHGYTAKWTAARQQGAAPIVCAFSETGVVRASTLAVYEMWLLGVNAFEESPPPPRIELAYSPGKPAMEIVQTCPPGGPQKSFLELFPWAFLMLHGLELDHDLPFLPPVFVYRVEDWIVRQGALYAQRTYQRATSSGAGEATASEVTGLYLFHKPGG